MHLLCCGIYDKCIMVQCIPIIIIHIPHCVKTVSDSLSLHLHPSVPLPVEPSVSVVSITATSISLSWRVPTDQRVTSSEVMWQTSSSSGPTTRAESEGTSGSITDTSYTIEGLESNTTYIITVTVTNVAGSTTSPPLNITTTEGEHT